MKAVVLVGGEGTRLRPLTLDTPKQMLPVVDTTMIERVLGHLGDHGVDEAVLSLGYRPEAFLAAFPDGLACGIKLRYAVDPEPLDTAGAIRFAAQEIAVSETFIVVNGDVLTDADFSALLARHRQLGAEATIHLTPVSDPSAFGVVPTDDGGRVLAFIEKPKAGEAPTNLINAGAYVLEPAVLDLIPPGRRVSAERETFPALVARGGLFGWPSEDYWIDAGTPDAYLRACLDLVGGARPGSPVPGAWRASPDVWAVGVPDIGGQVRGPALVADGSYVAPGAELYGSVLGAGAQVAPGAKVAGSVLLAGARVCVGARVEGSIIGPCASVGQGATVGALSVLGRGAMVAPGAQVIGGRISRMVDQ
ncbi:MAG: sugar phosphate nucleotidyltransferase [Acidimicrobiales bacterium]